MKRLALVLAVAALTSGCIFLTPPTGIRLGNHTNEFGQNPGPANLGAMKMNTYTAGDFSEIYPDFWTVSQNVDTVSRDGKTVKRVSIGQAALNGEVEGLQITTLMGPLDPNPAKNLQALGQLVIDSLQGGLKSDAQLVGNDTKNIDGETALRIEIAGTGLDELDPTTGRTQPGIAQHFLAYCTWHQGRGFIIVISTPESRWATLKDVFDGMVEHFKFTGGPIALCGPNGSIAPSPSPVASASASPAPSPTSSAAAADKGASGADQAASAAASLTVCYPSASPSAGASPSTGATPSAGTTPKPAASVNQVVGPIQDAAATKSASPAASASPGK